MTTTTPWFSQWDDAIDAAQDEIARRRLLGEIGRWRAAHLTDVPALRAASWALSTVHEALGDRAAAEHEAAQLIELCRVSPAAPGGARQAAERRLASLQKSSPEAKAKAHKARTDQFRAALIAAQRGDLARARKGVSGRGGVRAASARQLFDLVEARAAKDPLGAIDALIAGWFDHLGAPGEEGSTGRDRRKEGAEERADASKVAPRDRAPDRPPEGPLETLMGAALPKRRNARLAAVEAWMDAHPGEVDAVAAAALHDHVQARGPKSVAPWLFSWTVRALAETDGVQTRAALEALSDAWATTAAREAGFELLVTVAKAAHTAGWRVVGVRRGVVRAEPDDRAIWTLRVAPADGAIRRVSVVAPVESPWPEGVPEQVAGRIAGDEPVVLRAPGAAHQALREAVADRVVVQDDGFEGDWAGALLAAAEAMPAVAPAPAEPSSTQGPSKPRAASPKPEGPSPVARLRELLTGEAVPDVAALSEPLALVRRVAVALRGMADLLAPHADADDRLGALLDAVHQTAPDTVRPIAAWRLALEGAARLPGGAVATLLGGGDARAARYGGDAAAALAAHLAPRVAEGWRVDRLDVGIGRRDAERIAGLGPLADEVRGLWRVGMIREDARRTLWWFADPSPEAVAAAALLLAEGAPDGAGAIDAASAEAVQDVVPSVAVGAELDAAWASALGGATP